MKKGIKALLITLVTVVILSGGAFAYHNYDDKLNGFSKDSYEICLGETACAELGMDLEGCKFWAADKNIVSIDENNQIVGTATGRTKVFVWKGIHFYAAEFNVIEHDVCSATCTEPAKCLVCGVEMGEPLGHTTTEATCTEPSVCTVCGEELELAIGHKESKGGCEDPVICEVCGEELAKPAGHTESEGDCDETIVCTVCGQDLAPAPGHNYEITYEEGMQTIYQCTKCLSVYITFRVSNIDDEYKGYTYEVSEAELSRYSEKEKEVLDAMLSLQSEYPNGTSWTNANYYKWNGGLYSGGYGCAGFSFMLSDAAFGSTPARKTYDSSDIKIGDILRVDGDSHSVIVIGYDKSGVIVAEGNFNYSVRWGRYIKFSELNITYILTRY